MKLHSLENRLQTIAACLRLDGSNLGDYKRLGTIEGLAHERAHFIDLGEHFEKKLYAMNSAETALHEIVALRVEIAGLAKLGVHICPRRLWKPTWAYWGGPKPSFTRMRAPLSPNEQQLVDGFVTLILTESSRESRAEGLS